MKKIICLAVGFFLTLGGLNLLAQNTNLHDSSFDNKSIRKINLDNNNANGVITVQGPATNSGTYTVTVPAITDTIVTQNAGSEINWTDIRAYGTSHGGDHSGLNWQSFGV